MVNYLMRKSRDGTIYKAFLWTIGILVLVGSVSSFILVEVLSEKEIKGFFW